jgi:hypothetical protein
LNTVIETDRKGLNGGLFSAGLEIEIDDSFFETHVALVIYQMSGSRRIIESLIKEGNSITINTAIDSTSLQSDSRVVLAVNRSDFKGVEQFNRNERNNRNAAHCGGWCLLVSCGFYFDASSWFIGWLNSKKYANFEPQANIDGLFRSLRVNMESVPKGSVVISYVKTYSNGFAFFAVSGGFCGRNTERAEVGNHSFFWGSPTLFFYVFETSAFFRLTPQNRIQLFEVLSDEELADLSQRNFIEFWQIRNPLVLLGGLTYDGW